MLMRSLSCLSLKLEAELGELQAYDSQLWDDEWDDFEPEGEIPSQSVPPPGPSVPSCGQAHQNGEFAG